MVHAAPRRSGWRLGALAAPLRRHHAKSGAFERSHLFRTASLFARLSRRAPALSRAGRPSRQPRRDPRRHGGRRGPSRSAIEAAQPILGRSLVPLRLRDCHPTARGEAPASERCEPASACSLLRPRSGEIPDKQPRWTPCCVFPSAHRAGLGTPSDTFSEARALVHVHALTKPGAVAPHCGAAAAPRFGLDHVPSASADCLRRSAEPHARPRRPLLPPRRNTPGPRPIGSEAESLALKAHRRSALSPLTGQCSLPAHSLSHRSPPLSAPRPPPQHALDRLETIREKYPDGHLRLEALTSSASGAARSQSSTGQLHPRRPPSPLLAPPPRLPGAQATSPSTPSSPTPPPASLPRRPRPPPPPGPTLFTPTSRRWPRAWRRRGGEQQTGPCSSPCTWIPTGARAAVAPRCSAFPGKHRVFPY